MRPTARKRAADSEREAFAQEITAREALGSDQMMYAGAGRESDAATARHDAREELRVLTRHRIPANHAQILAEASEKFESIALKCNVGAEVVVQPLALRRRHLLERTGVMNRKLHI